MVDVQALQHWMQSDYLTNVEKAMEAMEVVSGHANTRDVIISCGEASPHHRFVVCMRMLLLKADSLDLVETV